MATVVRVKGTGGVVFDMDTPPEGSFARERYDEQIAKGDLVVIGADGEPVEPAVVEPAEPVELEMPHANAARTAWEAYALAMGFPADEIDGLGRNDIRALFIVEPGEPVEPVEPQV